MSDSIITINQRFSTGHALGCSLSRVQQGQHVYLITVSWNPRVRPPASKPSMHAALIKCGLSDISPAVSLLKSHS